MSAGRRVLAVLCLACTVSVAAAIACSGTSSSDTIPLITGITIRAENLTAGRGCGTAPGQVFKYAAVVLGRTNPGAGFDTKNAAAFNQPITGNVYDCFADGTFVQLPVFNDTLTFRIEVFVYDATTYGAAQGTLAKDMPIISRAVDATGNAAGIPAAMPALAELRATPATWTTTCVATQQQDVQVLAVCDPLTPGLGGLTGIPVDAGPPSIDLQTTSFRLGDGGTIGCLDPDAAAPDPDAGDQDADAGDDAEAGAGNGYRTVRVTPRSVRGTEATVDVTCPAPFHFEPAAPSINYDLDVTLLGSGGAAVGQTTCSAFTEPGAATPATCQPVR